MKHGASQLSRSVKKRSELVREAIIFLEKVASEVIGEIISYVPHPQTSLILYSKLLLALTEPVLYANVALMHKTSYPTFMRTMARRPDLVHYVTHFQTSTPTAGWDFDLSFLRGWGWIRRTMRDFFNARICDDWFKEIFTSRSHDSMSLATSWDAITAFLLCLFSAGLRSIRVERYGS